MAAATDTGASGHRTKGILVIGSSNTDMIIRVPRIPRPGETILGGAFSMAPGGKGANQAVAAARAGGRVTFLVRVGDDVFGSQALENFVADGIDLGFAVRDPAAATGVALINVADDGENAISVAQGANGRLSVADVERARPAFEEAGLVLTQLETPLPAVRAAVRLARERGIPVILNPAPACALDDDFLAAVTIVTPNESEAEILTGIPVHGPGDAARAAAALRRRGPRVAVVTLGERGAWADGPEYQGPVETFPVHAVDTTAAGDVFNGALAAALAEERPLREALRFASAAAAISVTRAGAQPSAPRRAEIDAFLAAGGRADP